MDEVTNEITNEITIQNLIENNNDSTSFYEDEYIKYVNIHFDKKQLSDLLYELKYLLDNNEWPERQEFLYSLLKKYDLKHLNNLLTGEEQTSRFALIEKWARIASMEILIYDRYSIETLATITRLPMDDYKMVVRRTSELVSMIRDITSQAVPISTGVAGV